MRNEPSTIFQFGFDSTQGTDPSVLVGISADMLAQPWLTQAALVLPVAVKTAAQTMVLYLTETGDKQAISVDDIHQGQIGDCYLLSSIGEITLNSPAFIQNMIHANSNGTETVTLYTASNGRLPGFGTTAFRAISEVVTNVFPANSVNNGATQDVVGNQKEIWVQVLEKAFATLNGGYGAIQNGGYPTLAMEELTGKAATTVSPASMTLSQLQADVTNKDLITMDTSQASSTYNLVGGHCYMFDSIIGSGTSAMAHLLNPWGMDQPKDIPIAQLSKAFVQVDVGHYA